MIEFFIFSGFLNAIFFTAISFFVFFSNPKGALNRMYALFSFATAWWGISYVFWLESSDYNTALFWTRMINLCAIFIPIFFGHWLLILLGLDKKWPQKVYLALSYLAGLFFAAISFTPYYISGVEQKLFFNYWPIPGTLHPIFLAICWGLIVWYPIGELFKAYLSSKGYKRSQLKYLFWVVALGFLGGESNFLLWYGIPALPWGNIAMSFWGLAMIFIIFRYRFMDFSLILGKTGILLFAAIPVFFYTLLFSYIKRFVSGEINLFLLEFGFVLTGVLLFNFSYNIFERLSGRYFYYAYYNLKEKISILSKNINQMTDLKVLSRFISASLLEAFNIDKTMVVLRDPDNNGFYAQEAAGFSVAEISSFLKLEKEFLPLWFRRTKKILVKDEIPLIVDHLEKDKESKILEEKFKELVEVLDKAGVGVLIPLFVKEDLIGFIVLGDKEAGKLYNIQELGLLDSLAVQASVALNNSLSYGELKKRGAELERFNKAVVDRELKMVELKNEVKDLREKISQTAKI